MKKTFFRPVLALALAVALLLGAFPMITPASAAEYNKGLWGDNGDGTYNNPILPGDYSDPDIIRVGADYFAITSTMNLSPGVTVLHSTDLVNWTILGGAVKDITRIHEKYGYDTMDPAGYGTVVWAACITFNEEQQKFYIHFGAPQEGLFVCSTTKEGIFENDWSDLEPVTRPDGSTFGAGWNDCGVIWDADGWNENGEWEPDGHNYIVTNSFYQGYKSWLFELSDDGTQVIDDGVIIHGSGDGMNPEEGAPEGIKIFEHDGSYYFFHNAVVGGPREVFFLRSQHIYGDVLDEEGNVIGSGTRENLGTYVHSPDGVVENGYNEWCQGNIIDTPDPEDGYEGEKQRIVYNHQGHGSNGTGRPICLVPVIWDADGFPVAENRAQQWTNIENPLLSDDGSTTTRPQTSDDFLGTPLGPQWMWNFQPNDEMWSLTDRLGYLRIYADTPLETDRLNRARGSVMQRSYTTDANIATTKMDISHMTDGQNAGMQHVASDRYNAVGVRMEGGQKYMATYTSGGYVNKLAEVPEGIQSVYFKSEWDSNAQAKFYYSFDGVNYTLALQHGLEYVSYRGDSIGFFCYNNNEKSGYVDFDYLHYDFDAAERAPLIMGVDNGATYDTAPAITIPRGDITVNGKAVQSVSISEPGTYTVTATGENGKSTSVTFHVTSGQQEGPSEPVLVEDFNDSQLNGTTTYVNVTNGQLSPMDSADLQFEAGIDGTALRFNGSYGLDVGALEGKDSYTVSLWVKSDNNSGVNAALFVNRDNGTSGNENWISARFENVQPYLWYKNGSVDGSTHMVGKGNTNVSGRWIQYAYVMDNGTVRMYVDGQKIAEGSDPTIAQHIDFYLGGTFWGGDVYRGLMDQVEIYDGALTDTQMQTLYRQHNAAAGKVGRVASSDVEYSLAEAMDLAGGGVVTVTGSCTVGESYAGSLVVSNPDATLTLSGAIELADLDNTAGAALVFGEDFAGTVALTLPETSNGTVVGTVDGSADVSNVTVAGLSDDQRLAVSGGKLVIRADGPDPVISEEFDGSFDESFSFVENNLTASGQKAVTYETGIGGGQALKLDGSYGLKIGTLNHADAYTVSLWLKPAAAGNDVDTAFFGNRDDGTSEWADQNWIALRFENQAPLVWFQNDGSQAKAGSGNTNVIDRWIHCALVWDNGQVYTYVDGRPVGSAAADPTNAEKIDLYLGATWWGQGDAYKGLVDQVQVYDAALTAQQMRNLYLEKSAEAGKVARYDSSDIEYSLEEAVANAGDQTVAITGDATLSGEAGNLQLERADVTLTLADGASASMDNTAGGRVVFASDFRGTVALTMAEVPDGTVIATVEDGADLTNVTVNGAPVSDDMINGAGQLVIHVHDVTYVEGRDATCAVTGMKPYYHCGSCGKYFEDADCTREITDINTLVLELLPHTMSASYDADHADASCHYLYCTVCGIRGEGEDHVWNIPEATDTEDKVCTICGYVGERAQQHYSVTVTTEGQGEAFAAPASAVEGEEVVLTAVPTDESRFVEWQVVEGDVTIRSNRFTMPAENVTVKAVFEAYTPAAYPAADYSEDFDDDILEEDTQLYNGAVVQDGVLSLDGQDDYLSLPTGMFDGMDEATISFDVKTQTESGNYFTFTIGQNDSRYFYARVEDNDIYSAITTASWGGEDSASIHSDESMIDVWHTYTVVFRDGSFEVYLDGELQSTQESTRSNLSDLGPNAQIRFGRSFYSGDRYFDGEIDNIRIWNSALEEGQVYAAYRGAEPTRQYTVTVETNGNGTASADPTEAVAGTRITLTAEANEGYSFQEWQVVSGSVTIQDNQFDMPAENVTVKAIFEEAEVEEIPVTGVTLNQKSLTVTEGETATLLAAVEPADATDQTVTWTTSDDQVATVDGGVVTAVAEGKATITVTTVDGGFTDTCEVTVESEEVPHVHEGVLVAAVEPTCTQDGSKAYYQCACGKYFEDADCTSEITDLNSWKVIPATGHTYGWDFDADQHWKVCSACQTVDEASRAAHTWVKDDKRSDGKTIWYTCVCGAEKFEQQQSSGGGGGVVRYTVTVTQSAGGQISPSTTTVARGADKTFTITADEGYAISDVLVDGRSVGAVSEYTFENVSAKHTLTAEFTKTGETPAETVGGFTDVAADAWYAEAVQYAVDEGLMNGTSETAFTPNGDTTRGMIVTILYRLAGSPNVESDGAAWYSDARAWAMEEASPTAPTWKARSRESSWRPCCTAMRAVKRWKAT